MNAFQVAGCATILVLFLWTIRGVRSGRLGRGAAAGWCALWLAGFAAIIDPDLTVRMARFLGIGRGTDLVLYVAILGGLAAFLVVHIRMRRLETEITKIVRHIALSQERGGTAALPETGEKKD